jgi:hypothetical protein
MRLDGKVAAVTRTVAKELIQQNVRVNAATIAFLASDDASFFVGDTVSPNGGFVTS